MKQKFTIFLITILFQVLLLVNTVSAAYLKNIPVNLQQPDGTSINAYATGDEYFYRIHDIQNYTITLNKTTGFYVYARLVNDELVPSEYIVGQTNPQLTEIQPGACISPQKWLQLRHDFWENTPSKTVPGNQNLVPLSAGTINNIVIYIRFSDQTEFTHDVSYYDGMFNSTAPTANSMYNYYKEASFNTLFINSTYYPLPSGTLILSYQDTHERNYYAPFDTVTNPIGYHDNQRTSREHSLLVSAVNAIAGQVPAGLNIDYDNDTYVDNVCFIIKGGTTAWSTLLWPHRWSLFSQSVYINSKRVWDYNLQLDDFLSGSGNGVLCHEMFHTLGAPDLYHYSGDGNSPVGSWDIMESNTNPPQSMGAYMKYQYGNWINSIPTITASGTYTLNPVTSSTNNCYKLYSPNSTTEFFVFEYRKKTGTFENSIPGSGLLIYRINTTVGAGNADGPPDEVYVYRPGGSPTSNGTVSQANFSTETGRTDFNNTTNPYGFFTDGSLANIDISNVTSSSGSTISFTVNVGTATNFTANKTITCTGSTVVFTDQTIGMPTTWSWSFAPASVSYVDGTSASSQNPHVVFTANGQYSVTLTATGPGGSNTKTKSNYITILGTQALPFADNFESNSFATQNWSIDNPDNAVTWALKTVGGNTPGVKAAYMNFYDYGSQGEHDMLITPPVSLNTGSSAMLTFKVAYRQYDATYHDSLKVLVYSNCGETLHSIPYVKTGTALATGPATTSPFTPSAASDWRTDTVLLNGISGNVIIKFLAVNDYGNNLYIDDVNFVQAGTQLTGLVSYLNAGNTHLDSTVVYLKQGNTTIQQTSVNGAGIYSFSNVANGTYTLTATSTKKWGGVNATDALVIMKHFVGMSLLSGLKLKAANCDLNPAINSIDALMAQKRGIGLLTAFPAGDWTFTTPSVTIPGPGVYTQNINGLTVADVNGSYVPYTKSEPSIHLLQSGTISTGKDGISELPLLAGSTIQTAAVTMLLNIDPAAEVVNLSSPLIGDDKLLWQYENHRLSVSWFDVEPITLNPGDVFLILSIRMKGNSGEAPGFTISCDAVSEMADENATVLNNVQFMYPKLLWSDLQGYECLSYPNPFTDLTTLHFTIPVEGRVEISVYGIDGKKIIDLYNQITAAGEHLITWDGKDAGKIDVPSGIYYFRMLINDHQIIQKISRVKDK